LNDAAYVRHRTEGKRGAGAFSIATSSEHCEHKDMNCEETSEALACYQPYKERCSLAKQDESAILSTLPLFVRDLPESR
jgi:hypothetical protein